MQVKRVQDCTAQSIYEDVKGQHLLEQSPELALIVATIIQRAKRKPYSFNTRR